MDKNIIVLDGSRKVPQSLCSIRNGKIEYPSRDDRSPVPAVGADRPVALTSANTCIIDWEMLH